MNRIKNNNFLYVPLKGRIGNQFFIYAFARSIQITKKNCKIIIDDSEVRKLNWENSLINYNLPDVEYVHDRKEILFFLPIRYFIYKIIHHFIDKKEYSEKFKCEKKLNKLFNKFGIFFCENGFLHCDNLEYISFIDGYFQSEKYFENAKEEIKSILNKNFDCSLYYDNISKLINRNTVCISVKVEHNIGSKLYDVCDINYWKRAINYIIGNVKNPLFFICSDNVDYVLTNLIDANKYEYIVQNKEAPVHISLEIMSKCKHFIIGNSTYAWWAQYLNDNDDKIVIAPKKWMKVKMPIDIYQDNWILM